MGYEVLLLLPSLTGPLRKVATRYRLSRNVGWKAEIIVVSKLVFLSRLFVITLSTDIVVSLPAMICGETGFYK
jgi:hypothetical protein